MPRKPIIRSHEHFYHVVARTNNKELFHLPVHEIWVMMCYELSLLQKGYNLKIGAFVVMSNHFHLLVMTPKEDIDRVMYFFMKNITRKIQKKTGRINRIFGGRYKGCIIENHRYLMNVYKYIYRNPVAAGLCDIAEDYEFSTLSHLVQGKKLPIEISEIDGSRSEILAWINESFTEQESQNVKTGLKKAIFEYPKDRNLRTVIVPRLPIAQYKMT